MVTAAAPVPEPLAGMPHHRRLSVVAECGYPVTDEWPADHCSFMNNSKPMVRVACANYDRARLYRKENRCRRWRVLVPKACSSLGAGMAKADRFMNRATAAAKGYH